MTREQHEVSKSGRLWRSVAVSSVPIEVKADAEIESACQFAELGQLRPTARLILARLDHGHRVDKILADDSDWG